MAYWEEGYSEGMARDRKQRKKANQVLTKFFEDHKGEPVEQAYAYNQLVSSYDEDKDHTCHWAFYEWIEKQIQEQEAIMADYQDWIDRHHGDYNGDYWE